MEHQLPLGVKLVAIYGFIGAFFALLIGFLALAGGSLLGSIVGAFALLGSFAEGLLTLAAFFFFGVGLLNILLSLGLLKRRKWARMLVIVFSIIGAVFAVVSMFYGSIASNLFNLFVNLLIAIYLITSANVKELLLK